MMTRRERKRKEAIERQSEYSSLNTREKIERAESRRGKSYEERTRLHDSLERE